MRYNADYNTNTSNKRGVVVDRDPKKKKVKVQFEDEDDQVTFWIDVTAKSAGTTKSFMMPDLNDEVWCAIDAKGEDGCILGSKYNDKDAPPHQSNDDISLVGPWGSIHIDKGGGALTINLNGGIEITAGGEIKLNSSKLTHNGKNIGHDHKHKDVTPGSSPTGEPVD